MIHGKHWVPVLAVAAVTTGMVIADQYDAGYFRRTTTLNTSNAGFSSTNTATGMVLAPIAFYASGYLFKNNYAKQTALLSGEAALDGEIVGYSIGRFAVLHE
ncbi:MAG TPA: hypothetical protein VHU83_22160 [Bryobacteraceae bacterium]|nr:hypothetical protein [Bryobacteraceae bacterium]